MWFLTTSLLPFGRMPRWRFLALTLLGVAAWLPAFGNNVVLLARMAFAYAPEGWKVLSDAPASYIALGLFGTYVTWVAFINRLHDIGRTAAWLLLPLAALVLKYFLLWDITQSIRTPGAKPWLPLDVLAWGLIGNWALGIIAALVLIWLYWGCLTREGEAWDNKYGPPPGIL